MELIKERSLALFSQIYFGHQRMEMVWSELGELIDELTQGGVDANEVFSSMLALAESGRLPQSPAFNRRTFAWLKHQLKLSSDDLRDSSLLEEPQYVFKSYEVAPNTTVALLEENRDPLGQGCGDY